MGKRCVICASLSLFVLFVWREVHGASGVANPCVLAQAAVFEEEAEIGPGSARDETVPPGHGGGQGVVSDQQTVTTAGSVDGSGESTNPSPEVSAGSSTGADKGTGSGNGNGTGSGKAGASKKAYDETGNVVSMKETERGEDSEGIGEDRVETNVLDPSDGRADSMEQDDAEKGSAAKNITEDRQDGKQEFRIPSKEEAQAEKDSNPELQETPGKGGDIGEDAADITKGEGEKTADSEAGVGEEMTADKDDPMAEESDASDVLLQDDMTKNRRTLPVVPIVIMGLLLLAGGIVRMIMKGSKIKTY